MTLYLYNTIKNIYLHEAEKKYILKYKNISVNVVE